MDLLVYLFIGLLIGFALGFLISISRQHKSKLLLIEKENEWISKLQTIQNELSHARGILDSEKSSANELRQRFETNLNDEKKSLQQISQLTAEKQNLEEKLNGQKSELIEMQKQMRESFENLANRLLKSHSEEFTTLNQQKISEILIPLKEKIISFESRVNETYDKTIRDHQDLKGELKRLHEMNTQISQEANNLAKALKGDTRNQGSWGEIVLGTILAKSGLVKDREYFEQQSTTDEGARFRPDVVVALPDEKHIVIDSKVSLVAYEQFVNAETEIEKQTAVKSHLVSIRRHINELSEKHYEKVRGLNTPDFVIMFVPIESTFSISLQRDAELFNYAWEKRIIIVSPTTLLATLMTVSSIWRQEKQSKNALEIARQSGLMLEELARFYNHLEIVDKKLDDSKRALGDAMSKLKTGRGNVIGRAQKIRLLGAKSKSELPEVSDDLFEEIDKENEESSTKEV